MDDAIAQRYQDILSGLDQLAKRHERDREDVVLVAVSKTFPSETIEHVVQLGQRIFGENRVQELQDKWVGLKQKYPDCRVHLIGPLQSNKVRKAVQIADVIETVDRVDLVDRIVRISAEEERLPDLFCPGQYWGGTPKGRLSAIGSSRSGCPYSQTLS
jgi:Predicted enzyme with a TIM-barrel fold